MEFGFGIESGKRVRHPRQDRQYKAKKQSTVRNRPGCSEGSVLAVRTDELGGRNTGYKKTWTLQRNLEWIFSPSMTSGSVEQEYAKKYKRK